MSPRWRPLLVRGLFLASAFILAGCGGAAAPAPQSPAGGSAPAGGSSAPAASAQPGTPKQGGELIYVFNLADWSSSPNLDPQRAGGTEEHTAYHGVFDTMVQQAPDGDVKPHLAESWEISSDALTYTFKLRKDVKFHDGTPFTAKALKAMFDRARDPNNRAQSSYSYIPTYKGNEIVDDHTFKVHLNAPQANFLTRLTRYFYGIPSPTQLEKVGEAGFGKAPVGSGPFKFQEYLAGDHATIVRNPDYNWGPAIRKHTGPAYLDKITFRFALEASTRIALLESGQAHVIEYTPEQDAARLQKSDKFQLVKQRYSGMAGVWYLNTQKPPTNDKAVRHALGYALDREKLNEEVFFGQYQPSYWYITPNLWGYDASLESKAPKYDPNRAKSLLDGAGWKPGPDGVRVKDGQRLTFEAVTSGDSRPCEFMQDQYKQVGIEMKIKSLTPQGITESARRGEGNAFGRLCGATRGWVNEDADVLRIHFDSAQITIQNQSQTNVPEIDKLLKDGINARFGSEERRAAYRKLQETLLDYYPAVNVIQAYQLLGAAKNVKDVSFTSVTYTWLNDVWLDK